MAAAAAQNNSSSWTGNQPAAFSDNSTNSSENYSPESFDNYSYGPYEDNSATSFPEIWRDDMIDQSPMGLMNYYDSGLISQIPAESGPISLAFPVSNLSRENGSDFLVINITSDPMTRAFSTQISALSGANGSRLWQKDYPDSLAFALPAGDLNGDRHSDIMVNVVIAGTSFIPYSSVTALDGRNGEEIWNEPHLLAATLAYPIKDVTGDNVTEFLVHVFGIDSLNGTVATKIAEVDGATGTQLGSKVFSGALAVEYPAGNFTGDRVQDGLAAIYAINQTEQNVTTEIDAVDGQDHARLWNRTLAGLALAVPVKDLTGDGRDEVMAYLMGPADNNTSIKMAILQGSDGELLWENSFGNSLPVAMVGPDLTGDGKPDLIIYKLGSDGDSLVQAVKGDDGSTLWSKMGTIILPQ